MATYQVVILGLKPDQDRGEALQRLAATFKQPVDRLSNLVSGTRAVVKYGADIELAARLQAAIEASGWVCALDEEVSEVDAASPSIPPSNPPQAIGNQSAVSVCTKCGKEMSANAKFCKHCGASRTSSHPAVPNGTPPRTAPTASVCAACGAELSVTAKFCRACGAKQSAHEFDSAPNAQTTTPLGEAPIAAIARPDQPSFDTPERTAHGVNRPQAPSPQVVSPDLAAQPQTATSVAKQQAVTAGPTASDGVNDTRRKSAEAKSAAEILASVTTKVPSSKSRVPLFVAVAIALTLIAGGGAWIWKSNVDVNVG